MKAKNTSPYLGDNNRLGDVIAAIQVMAVYKFYKLPFSDWADRINADAGQADKWEKIFKEHPEFFRLDSERKRASLVWRRQFPKRYDVDAERVISFQDYNSLTVQQKCRISRTPLTPGDIKALIDTAVSLHSRALEHQKDKRWWTAIAGAIGGLVGSIAGALIK
ncbi:hypothetical protein [Pseudomonas subflava]|uniref:hypothetical protein n=1 Tax=Pseudomonas subflava TaxID=2952933 RepID=UPI00207A701D|nr:hypothetical protein [Pseudomonas subflava]